MTAYDLKRDDVISKGRIQVVEAVWSDPSHNSVGLVTITGFARGRLFHATVDAERPVA